MTGILVPITMIIAIAVPALVIALMQSRICSKAFVSVARQPQIAGQVRTLLLVALAFMETLVIYGLLISLMLVSKIY